MNNKNNSINEKLKIIITVGDDSGIGPEVILKALFSKEIPDDIEWHMIGHLQRNKVKFIYINFFIQIINCTPLSTVNS